MTLWYKPSEQLPPYELNVIGLWTEKYEWIAAVTNCYGPNGDDWSVELGEQATAPDYWTYGPEGMPQRD